VIEAQSRKIANAAPGSQGSAAAALSAAFPASGPGRVPRDARVALTLLFAIAACWSIAVAQGAVLLLALTVAAGLILGHGGVRRIRGIPWTLKLVLVFLGVQALSIPFGVHPVRSLAAFKGSWVMLFPFVFWIALTDARVRALALRALAASGALAGVYGVAQHFLGREYAAGKALERLGSGYIAVGTLGHHLSYAGVLLPIFFVALALALDGLSSGRARDRWLWGIAVCAIALGLLFSYARTAWIGLAAGLFVLGLLRGRRAFLVIAGATLALFALAMCVEPSIAQRFFSMLHGHGTPERTRLWLTSLRIAADHPVIGAGLGSFGTLFDRYRVAGAYQSTAHPHCDLLNVLVETGALGVLAWSAIWAAFFLRRTAAYAPAAPPGAAQAPAVPSGAALTARAGRGVDARSWMPAALGAAVAALLVGGLGQCFSTDEKVAQVWWFVTAVGLRDAWDAGRAALAPPGSGEHRG